MIDRELLALINIALALLAVPPAVYLLFVIYKERKVIKTEQGVVNSTLSFLFGGFAVGALLNACVAVLSLTGNGEIAHQFSPIRGVYTNALFSVIAWTLFYVRRTHSSK